MSDEVKNAPTGIDEAMMAVMKEVGAIGKNQISGKPDGAYSFKYRGISDVYDAAHAAMVKAGVYMLPEVLSREREERTTSKGGAMIYTFLTVRYKFMARDGSFRECVVCGEGMDSGDKSSNKALAAAHKYAITQSLVIPYSEMVDGDAEMPEQSTRGAATNPDAINKRTGQPLPPPPPVAKKGSPEAWTQGYIAGLKPIDSMIALNAYTSAHSAALMKLDKVASDLRDRIEMAIAEKRHEIERAVQLAALDANPFGEGV